MRVNSAKAIVSKREVNAGDAEAKGEEADDQAEHNAEQRSPATRPPTDRCR